MHTLTGVEHRAGGLNQLQKLGRPEIKENGLRLEADLHVQPQGLEPAGLPAAVL